MDDTVGSGELSGVRVLDMSGPIGAYCTHLLADLGADVVLVEPPEGDPLRQAPPFKDDDEGASLAFAYYHSSKRSVTLGPDDEDERARLGAAADVVVVSPSPRTPLPGWDAANLTLDWAPDAIVCSITPFGLTGPRSGWRSTPMVSYAMGGNMIRIGPPEGPPRAAPGRLAWDEAGIHAAIAILGALAVVDSVGPQGIDFSVHEVQATKDFFIEQYDVLGMSALGRQITVGYPPTGTYQCVDGPFDVAAHQVRHWDAFLAMLDHPDEIADPAFHDAVVRRDRHEELREAIERLLADRSRHELLKRGQAAGLPCAMLLTPTEFAADAQVEARAAIVPTPTPWGPMPMPASGSGYRTTPNLSALRSSAAAAPGGDDVEWRPRQRAVGREPRPERPLEGVRIISFGAFVAGYTTAAILGQLGADVVKIEPLDRPEVLRNPAYAIGPVATEPSGVPNTVMNASLSRSTRNLAADISTENGRALFLRLVEAADVVVENLGPGSQKTLGISFDALSEVNPRIVLTSLSGYGRTGPRSSYLAYATNISNFIGMTYEWDFCHGTLSDYITAAHAALGTLAGLRHVRAKGEGVWVDAAQIEAMTAAMPQGVLEAAVNGRDLPPPGNTVPGSLCSGVFACKGFDAWVAVEIEDLADWERACDLLEVPLEVDSASAARELQPALEAALHGWAAERTAHTAAHHLQQAGLAAGVVQSMEDIWRDPQIWARDFPVSLSQPDLGTYYYGDSFYRLSKTPGRVGHVGHRLGQDTTAVLSEWLGIGADEIAGLLDSGAAFQG